MTLMGCRQHGVAADGADSGGWPSQATPRRPLWTAQQLNAMPLGGMHEETSMDEERLQQLVIELDALVARETVR